MMRRPPAGPRAAKMTFDKKTLRRLFRYIAKYRFRLALVAVCILLSSVTGVASSLFLRTLIDGYIAPLLLTSSPSFSGLFSALLLMACIYAVGIGAGLVYNRTMATVSQGTLKDVRDDLFAHMQTLPLKYFDTHAFGDVMSRYTNDTDTLRQMISQSLPSVFSSLVTVIAVFFSMLSVSVWLTLFVIVCVFLMLQVTGRIAGKSGHFFVRQQKALGDLNGYIEETMAGQKVVKVFCHEEKARAAFDERNERLRADAAAANGYANVLMPVMASLGNLQYVLLAIVGGALAILAVPNLSLSGMGVLTLGAIAAFLQLSRSFVMPINQVSQQLNAVVMALAGAQRIFQLMDEASETDEGYVTLVCAKEENGVLTESDKRTGLWAWKHPHGDGTLTYTRLEGDIQLSMVDFAYEEGKDVLHDITIHAAPGQKVALVGATGAGKTTITNLLNRFYDIADGKIRYDGININKIRKSSLRRSLGVVLQEVSLFTGTVMENIRFGRLDATDEECVAAAKLVNADTFISMLPDGYQTVLAGDGSGLSQGQRQLLSIARAAVADPPAMILDEATSSIDTHTESLVQRGMDRLMEGRTVFVIAHRLSTVQNADVIMVLENGRIIERGSHDALIAKGGKYCQLYTGAFERG